MKRDNQDGVLITSVRPGGPAGDAKPAISRNDVLVAVNDRPVKNSQELADFTREITADAEELVPVLATFERRTGQYVTVIKVGIKEMNDPGLEVKKAWLPIETQVITRDIAKQMGDESLKGFRIIRVYDGSTADTAGLEVGDLITSVDGEALTATALEHYEELPTLIRNYRVGTEAELSVIRDGSRQAISVELIRAPKLDREMHKFRDENFEFTVRNVTFFDKADRQWEEEVRGVLVDEVQSGGWAAIAWKLPAKSFTILMMWRPPSLTPSKMNRKLLL